MTVKELIKELLECDMDLRVTNPGGYEISKLILRSENIGFDYFDEDNGIELHS